MIVGDTFGTWKIVALSRALDGSKLYVCNCVHCGVRRNMPARSTRAACAWHVGCTQPRPVKIRTYTRDTATPPGDSPLWAKWSAELEADPTLRERWTATRLSNVLAWRSNQRSGRAALEEMAERKDDRWSVP